MTEAKSLNKKRRGGSRGQSLVQGAAILTFGTILVKVIGAIFKIPLGNVIGEAGMGYFSAAYALYLPVYTLSAAGFPSALARQVAENTAMGRYKDARKVHRVAQRVFLITGILRTQLIPIRLQMSSDKSTNICKGQLLAVLDSFEKSFPI